MSGHPSSTILLPSELYSHIFSLIPSTQELRSLSQTSSIFYREALPFLYHTVDLTTTIARITAFSSALASNPTLGLHVRDLTIKCWYDPSDGDVRIDCEVLYHTILLATDNLRSLTILDTDLEFHDFEGMVSDCRFRLDAFHNLGEDLGVVYSFLIHQPTITHWSQCRPTRPRVAIIHLIHDQMLPNLTILNADINLPLVINKRNTVEELSLHYQWARGRQTFEMYAMGRLNVFGEKLTTLRLDRSAWFGEASGFQLLELVAGNVPGLKNLWIEDSQFWKVASNKELVSEDPSEALSLLSTSLAQISQLETFVYSPVPSDIDSFWWIICSNKGPDNVARALFSPKSPCLQTLVFPLEALSSDTPLSGIPAVRYSRSAIGDHQKDSSVVLEFGQRWAL